MHHGRGGVRVLQSGEPDAQRRAHAVAPADRLDHRDVRGQHCADVVRLGPEHDDHGHRAALDERTQRTPDQWLAVELDERFR